MSRLCHPNESVWSRLQMIIVGVLQAFPNHALWSLMAAYKSTQQERRNRAQKIISKLRDAKEPRVYFVLNDKIWKSLADYFTRRILHRAMILEDLYFHLKNWCKNY